MLTDTDPTLEAWWADLWRRIMAMVSVFVAVVIPITFLITVSKQPQLELLWIGFVASVVGAPLFLYWKEYVGQKALPVQYRQAATDFIYEWRIFEIFLDKLADIYGIGGSFASFGSKIELCLKLEVFNKNEIEGIEEIRSLRDFLMHRPTDLHEFVLPYESMIPPEPSYIEHKRQNIRDIMRKATRHPKSTVRNAALHAIRSV